MIFLIQYNRTSATVASMQTFANDQQEAAAEARLQLEIALLRNHCDGEVVVLEAENEEALKKTHRRYFENLISLAEPGSNQGSS